MEQDGNQRSGGVPFSDTDLQKPASLHRRGFAVRVKVWIRLVVLPRQ
jgi:hypothetical protein